VDEMDPRDVVTQGLDLPRGRERERVDVHEHEYRLRGSEVRMLATVGAFRVVLDDELKREYQQFLQESNRDRSDADGRPARTRDEVDEWAHAHDLPVVDDHVQFPDLRIEYEWADGRREVEDVEILTPHYRGAHAAAKARSGFTSYRSGSGRVGGRSARSGRSSRPFDPELAEEFLT